MTFLPIVERELRVAARLPATYRNRVIVAGVFGIFAFFVLTFGTLATNPGGVGSTIFWMLAYLVLALCLIEGVRKTANCLSEEKREGTLGLLFLTDLKSYDVVLGKLAGNSLSSLYGLMSVLPLMSLPLLLGGVTPGEFWRVALALADILFFSLSAGMWVSALSRDEQKAMVGTVFTVAFVCGTPFVSKTISVFSPLCAFHAADAKVYALSAANYWNSIGLTMVEALALLLWASVILPRSWQDEKLPSAGSRGFFARLTPQNAAKHAALRAEMLDTNPASWLAGRNYGRRPLLIVLMTAAFIAAVVFIFRRDLDFLPYFLGIIWAINVIIKYRITFQACHCLAEARRNSALEMLLVTPLTVQQIIRGQILALERIFLFPVSLIFTFEVIGLTGGLLSATYGKGDFGWQIVTIGLVALGYLGLSVVDIYAVIWTGMWYGLSAKREGQAAFKTILLVLVLPACCALLCIYGLPMFIGIPIFWISWASQNLHREFRRMAAQRYQPVASSHDWNPLPRPQNQLPPVI